MNSRALTSLLLCLLLSLLQACGDAEDEQRLLDLFTVAGLDIVEISFPVATTETTISIDSFFDYTVQGLQSNLVDTVEVAELVEWSISAGALSSIDQNGRLSTGSVAETVTLTATVGNLSASQMINVSDALFDKVVQLNTTTVAADMCLRTTIVPVARYVNADLSEEFRRVDNADIDSIEWLIRNKEDDSPSQRANIDTTDSVTEIFGYAAGTVLINARATSKFSMSIEDSDDFEQLIGNSLNSLSVCFGDADTIGVCELFFVDVPDGSVTPVIAVGNFQASDGSSFERNITELTKWGIDNSNASIALSTDRSQLNITGVTQDASSIISLACGEIQQNFTDLQLADGVVLSQAVTCDAANTDCLLDTVTINVVDEDLSSLFVQVNDVTLNDDVTFTFSTRPLTLNLGVTAIFNRSDNIDVTDDDSLSYTNNTPLLITAVSGVPGQYNVNGAGDVELELEYLGVSFTVRLTIP